MAFVACDDMADAKTEKVQQTAVLLFCVDNVLLSSNHISGLESYRIYDYKFFTLSSECIKAMVG